MSSGLSWLCRRSKHLCLARTSCRRRAPSGWPLVSPLVAASESVPFGNIRPADDELAPPITHVRLDTALVRSNLVGPIPRTAKGSLYQRQNMLPLPPSFTNSRPNSSIPMTTSCLHSCLYRIHVCIINFYFYFFV
ncbi:Kinesin-like protein KIN-13A [Iris pallida]|uniref:Kinesin-like protein KIN-13A n=1 Tax=Iris pallida TaxID=29817 RepID=A0AAX6H426_IRIPA|nr:Kinesin-like protein KIN-13A [Iris pallida]